jgi:putative ABC transport system substrate-binding protein
MRRRTALAVLGSGIAAWPFGVLGQSHKPARIGSLLIGGPDAITFQAELRGGLEDLGYVIGRDVVLEVRSANGQLNQLPALAADLVSSKPDVIVALYTPCALAVKAATREIPAIVVSGDPLGTGLVTSLARPGGNITGLSQLAAESHGKCVELLRDLLPSARRIATIWNGADPSFAKTFLEEARRAGATIGVEIHPIVEVRGPEELETAFVRLTGERAEAVVAQGSLPPALVAKLALAHRIPVGAVPRAFVENGALLSYGAVGPALFRRTASFVHRILQGARPGEMPVEQPTRFEFVVNLKTAQAMGIDLPQNVLARADEVIE